MRSISPFRRRNHDENQNSRDSQHTTTKFMSSPGISSRGRKGGASSQVVLTNGLGNKMKSYPSRSASPPLHRNTLSESTYDSNILSNSGGGFFSAGQGKSSPFPATMNSVSTTASMSQHSVSDDDDRSGHFSAYSSATTKTKKKKKGAIGKVKNLFKLSGKKSKKKQGLAAYGSGYSSDEGFMTDSQSNLSHSKNIRLDNVSRQQDLAMMDPSESQTSLNKTYSTNSGISRSSRTPKTDNRYLKATERVVNDVETTTHHPTPEIDLLKMKRKQNIITDLDFGQTLSSSNPGNQNQMLFPDASFSPPGFPDVQVSSSMATEQRENNNNNNFFAQEYPDPGVKLPPQVSGNTTRNSNAFFDSEGGDDSSHNSTVSEMTNPTFTGEHTNILQQHLQQHTQPQQQHQQANNISTTFIPNEKVDMTNNNTTSTSNVPATSFPGDNTSSAWGDNSDFFASSNNDPFLTTSNDFNSSSKTPFSTSTNNNDDGFFSDPFFNQVSSSNLPTPTTTSTFGGANTTSNPIPDTNVPQVPAAYTEQPAVPQTYDAPSETIHPNPSTDSYAGNTLYSAKSSTDERSIVSYTSKTSKSSSYRYGNDFMVENEPTPHSRNYTRQHSSVSSINTSESYPSVAHHPTPSPPSTTKQEYTSGGGGVDRSTSVNSSSMHEHDAPSSIKEESPDAHTTKFRMAYEKSQFVMHAAEEEEEEDTYNNNEEDYSGYHGNHYNDDMVTSSSRDNIDLKMSTPEPPSFSEVMHAMGSPSDEDSKQQNSFNSSKLDVSYDDTLSSISPLQPRNIAATASTETTRSSNSSRPSDRMKAMRAQSRTRLKARTHNTNTMERRNNTGGRKQQVQQDTEQKQSRTSTSKNNVSSYSKTESKTAAATRGRPMSRLSSRILDNDDEKKESTSTASARTMSRSPSRKYEEKRGSRPSATKGRRSPPRAQENTKRNTTTRAQRRAMSRSPTRVRDDKRTNKPIPSTTTTSSSTRMYKGYGKYQHQQRGHQSQPFHHQTVTLAPTDSIPSDEDLSLRSMGSSSTMNNLSVRSDSHSIRSVEERRKNNNNNRVSTIQRSAPSPAPIPAPVDTSPKTPERTRNNSTEEQSSITQSRRKSMRGARERKKKMMESKSSYQNPYTTKKALVKKPNVTSVDKTPKVINNNKQQRNKPSKPSYNNSASVDIVKKNNKKNPSTAAATTRVEVKKKLSAQHNSRSKTIKQAPSISKLMNDARFYSPDKTQQNLYKSNESTPNSSFISTPLPQSHPDAIIHMAGYRILSSAAIPIQSAVRKYLARKKVIHRVWAIFTVQAYIRRWNSEFTFSIHKMAAIQIQSAWRGWYVRDDIADKNFCATEIQRVVRGHSQFMRYHSEIYDIIVVQSIVRRNIAMKSFRTELAAMKEQRATVIQTAWRSYIQKVKYDLVIYDIITAQSVIRRFQAIQLAWELRDIRDNESAVIIQTAWRSYVQKVKYDLDVYDIVTAQSAVRMFQAKQVARKLRYIRANKSAVIIQNAWRQFYSRTIYELNYIDIVISQTAVRRFLATQYVKRLRDERANRSALLIQKIWRGFVERTDYVFTLSDIILVQSLVRRRLAMKQTSLLRNQLHQWAALTIQRYWRGYISCIRFQYSLVDIMLVQSLVRRWKAKREVQLLRDEKHHACAQVIQRHWRGFVARMVFQFQLVDIIIVQCVARRWIAKRRVSEMRNVRHQEAATSIQKVWRGYTIHMRFLYYLVNVIVVQSHVRAWIARRRFSELKYDEYTAAATTIQRYWRGYTGNMNYLFTLVHAIILQNAGRRYIARKLLKQKKMERFEKEWDKAIIIQKHWRGFWDYSHYEILKFEVTHIQSVYRGHKTRTMIRRMTDAAIKIQSIARMYFGKQTLIQKKVLSAAMHSAVASIHKKASANLIQRWYREFAHVEEQKRAALVIERFFVHVDKQVKQEVEIQQEKKVKRRVRKNKKKEEDMLDSLFESTVNNMSQLSKSGTASNSKKKKSRGGKQQQHHSSSSHHHHQRSNHHGRAPTPAITLSDDGSQDDQMSCITSPSLFLPKYPRKSAPRLSSYSRRDLRDDYSLEEAWIDTEIYQRKRVRGREDPRGHDRSTTQNKPRRHHHPSSSSEMKQSSSSRQRQRPRSSSRRRRRNDDDSAVAVVDHENTLLPNLSKLGRSSGSKINSRNMENDFMRKYGPAEQMGNHRRESEQRRQYDDETVFLDPSLMTDETF